MVTNTAGQLYLVPTPIGNLADMTYRGVEVLRSVDTILAEDTRHSQKLLNHFEIDTHQESYHQHNSQQKISQVIPRLLAGESFAQVSDAGMPAISDPGADLVAACIQAGIQVIPLPGANAGLTGLIASGLPTTSFTFLGFPPRKSKERNHFFNQAALLPTTVILYESPYRLKDTLADLLAYYPADTRLVVVRELTKKFEEFKRGSLSELVAYYQEQGQIKGEICIIIEANQAEIASSHSDQVNQELLAKLAYADQVDYWIDQEGLTSKAAIKHVAKANQVNKQEVYRAYHER
ncbi:16S rRNA methyltransferase [Aerococcus urinaehominis]|uniref:Ribosomal RNA small subunit methyltransferase I n=1 Tax=Aerococcus urinaehominis TaxID=128944 RepID=A0A109RGQ8_9LACT|nr:16S rRNA (cytidine(1402)-2'-O)-methyltransferase [Aerococcus urinaehominis]AMB99219.1 16S rRNA methyltransferase [Aerococcus urinaehominis]SDM32008.1 16S rRNA (cytidine1402-2'-O)-methyltransferase [Aerococcus urinaehominis]